MAIDIDLEEVVRNGFHKQLSKTRIALYGALGVAHPSDPLPDGYPPVDLISVGGPVPATIPGWMISPPERDQYGRRMMVVDKSVNTTVSCMIYLVDPEDSEEVCEALDKWCGIGANTPTPFRRQLVLLNSPTTYAWVWAAKPETI